MRGPLSQKFWKGRRAFVTGHMGFKGGWLVSLLSRLGGIVSGYSDAPPSIPNLFEVARISELGPSTVGDVRDGCELERAMRAAEPEVVLHLAAQPIVRRARIEPIRTISTNVLGTAQLLETARKIKSVRAVVVITSDKVYENAEWPWAYRETDRLGGQEPYGASKACAEIIIAAYRQAYFSGKNESMRVATVRAGNVIGGGDWAEDRIVPDAMRAFSRGEPLIVRNPAAIRPWQHVLEPLSGYLRLAETLLAGDPLPDERAFNFGPHAEDSLVVSAISDALAARWGAGAAWRQDAASHPHEARLLELDSALARTRLGWAPRWRLTDTLDRTVDWYKAFYGGTDMQAFTFAQIDGYLDA